MNKADRKRKINQQEEKKVRGQKGHGGREKNKEKKEGNKRRKGKKQ